MAWIIQKAEEFCEGVTDGTHDSPKAVEYGRYLITSKHLGEYEIDFSSAKMISEEDYKKVVARSKVGQWDILFSMIGTIGNTYLEKNEVVEYACKNMGIFQMGGDQEKAYWLYYYLKSPQAYEYISSQLRGSTQQYVPLGGLREFPIPVPDIKIRRKIVEVLKTIDEKIDTNIKINRNLQEQCDAIYKSYFVTNAEETWKIGSLADFITVKYGKDHKKLEDGTIPCYGSGGVMRYVEKALYDQESVLIPRKGSLNNVMYVNEPFWSVDTMFFTMMKAPNVAKFVYHFVKEKDLVAMNTGSAVPSMTADVLYAMELQIPPVELLEKFENEVSPLYISIQKNNVESKKLAELRDSLLPRLMSGELDVSDVDI